MKRMKSVFLFFLIFCVLVMLSLLIIYGYSTSSLRDSLKSAAQNQLEHSTALLEQKINEITIEADGVLNSGALKDLQVIVTEEDYDVYEYVMGVKTLKAYLAGRQESNVGMAEFVFYWPETKRIISSSTATYYKNMEDMLAQAADDRWFVYQNEVYYSRKYTTSWDEKDDEPYLLIRMDRDYLYKVVGMASNNVGGGGTFLIQQDGNSIFSLLGAEKELLAEVTGRKEDTLSYEIRLDGQTFQILESEILENGLKTISWYPIENIMRPVGRITIILGMSLVLLAMLGLFFMIQYYRNIMLQMQMLTDKLRQVENGDLNTRIDAHPDNEFSYVFEQFNRMLERISRLIDTTMREHELRSQAELRELQLQIRPHFLYNSLSYITTVADRPEAVTEMAVHLAKFYQYCMQNRKVTTIAEEIAFAKSYLSIMAMRKRIEYEIDVQEGLGSVAIIPLILQPIIENSIEHAIEARENAKHIRVEIGKDGEAIHFSVSDDGYGMTEQEISGLMERLEKKERDEETGIGLWNINQRLINYYGTSAGLEFSRSQWDGLKVSFTIPLGVKLNEGIDRG